MCKDGELVDEQTCVRDGLVGLTWVRRVERGMDQLIWISLPVYG